MRWQVEAWVITFLRTNKIATFYNSVFSFQVTFKGAMRKEMPNVTQSLLSSQSHIWECNITLVNKKINLDSRQICVCAEKVSLLWVPFASSELLRNYNNLAAKWNWIVASQNRRPSYSWWFLITCSHSVGNSIKGFLSNLLPFPFVCSVIFFKLWGWDWLFLYFPLYIATSYRCIYIDVNELK